MTQVEKCDKGLILDKRHLLVDANTAGRQFVYSTLHEAAAAIPDGTRHDPSVIYLMPDVYLMNGTATTVGLVIEKNWLTLQGLGEKPEDTVLADWRGHMVNAFPADNGANSPAQTIIVNGDGFHAENLTFGNYLNIDLDYPLDPGKSRKAVSDIITQAYALGSDTREKHYDCWSFENCRILGMLDTMAFLQKRVYFHDCLIRGTKDFLGGGETAVYEDCIIEVFDTCPMYKSFQPATLYKNCRFEVQLDDFDTLYITKYGGELILDHCDFTGNLTHIEWELETQTDGRCFARDVTLNGKTVLVSENTPWNTVSITKEMEASFSVYNLISGDDGWNPSNEVKSEKRPFMISITSNKDAVFGEEQELSLTVVPYVHADELIVESEGPVLIKQEGMKLFVTGTNEGTEKQLAVVRVSCHGVVGVCTLASLPAPQPQPILSSAPILVQENQEIRVVYEFEDKTLVDCSELTWTRKTDGRILAVSRASEQGGPCRSYRLTPADIGSQIQVLFTPRTAYSVREQVIKIESSVITEEDVKEISIKISDFSSFPCMLQKAGPGDFAIATYRPDYSGDETEHVADWVAGDPANAFVYGRGADGAKNDYGLLFAARGAALQYKAHGKVGTQKVKAVFCPDKDTGEGFGSANGQYLEILIKYNIETRTGYSLRIERKPQLANGCAFSLRKVDNGVSYLLCSEVLSSAFMSPCNVEVTAEDGVLSAKITTGWPKRPLYAQKNNIPDSAFLLTPFEENGFGDVELHHTGTVPVGNRTLLKELTISFD